MKSLFLSFTLIFLFSFSNSNSNYVKNNNTVSNYILRKENYSCKHGQCHATAKSTGRRCKHCVSNAGDYNCWQH